GKRQSKSVNGVVDTYYVYDFNGRLTAELNPSGALRSHFVYATQNHSPDLMIKYGVTYRLAKDHLGSIRAVINTQTGEVAQQISYDEFGVVLSDTNPGYQPFGFAGGHYDSDTKLVRFGARDYDAEVGRWTAKDPILFGGGDGNLYGYVYNSPTNLIDKLGNRPIDPSSQMPGDKELPRYCTDRASCAQMDEAIGLIESCISFACRILKIDPRLKTGCQAVSIFILSARQSAKNSCEPDIRDYPTDDPCPGDTVP
ncbi:MAG: RHS repeat-associated core domain-containing protein, partial [Bdellovibrionales bacterium]|nr:RHS repeat-associated core domain-containing protein [Bdellovibrionales bacterium]